MGNIGDTISTAVPNIGDANPAAMSSVLALLTEFKTRLATRVPMSSLAPANASLDMNGQTIENAQYVGLMALESPPSGAPYGRVARANGNLYYVDTAGAVQITAGSALNAAAVGGFVGDYGGVNPAKASFVDATETYEFYDNQSLTQWAMLKARQLNLVDEATGRVCQIRPRSTIAATYTLDLPAAPPGAGISLLALTNGGVMQLAEDGAITQAFTATVKHGDVTQWFPVGTFMAGTTVGTFSNSTVTGACSSTDPFTIDIWIPAPPVGRRLKGVSARILQSAGSTCTVSIFDSDDADATPDAVGTPGASAVVGSYQTVSATATDTVPAARIYKMRVAFTGGVAAATYSIASIAFTWDYV